MYFRKLFTLLALTIATFSFSQEEQKAKFYGFVRNDIFYNSRQNYEALDGIFNLNPKPIVLDANGMDKNACPQANLSCITTRLGVDLHGTDILGAKSSGKVEVDFAAANLLGSNNIMNVVRIRHAYTQLKWTKSELLIGQNWHPMFVASMLPSNFTFSAGAPYQTFSRTPMVSFKQHLTPTLTLTGAALSQLQFPSYGPTGGTNIYMKKSMTPEIFVSLENKTEHFTVGVAGDYKRLKPSSNTISSYTAMSYVHYSSPMLQVKAKTLLGQNLSDLILPWGYGVGAATTANDTVYVNQNMSSSYLNVAYGKTIQVGLFLGYQVNLGTSGELFDKVNNANETQYITYRFGETSISQNVLNNSYRIAPHISYKISNFIVCLEYERTTAEYGTMNKQGKGEKPHSVTNNRGLLSILYLF
jgi:hypothetical protein